MLAPASGGSVGSVGVGDADRPGNGLSQSEMTLGATFLTEFAVDGLGGG